MPRLITAIFVLLLTAPALARNVIFVDNARVERGDGSIDRPFTTLGEAQAVGRDDDVIYLAQGNAPYIATITLKKGQMLLGAAYGVDAAVVEFHTPITPPVPAQQGPGPTIVGNVWLTGDNVVAGCVIAAPNGSAVGAFMPSGPIALRKLFLRSSKQATALSCQGCNVPLSMIGGGIEASAWGSGVSIDGGSMDIIFEHVPITGTYAAAITIANRTGGAVKFRNASKIAIDDARSAITITNCKGTIAFESPVVIATTAGRGIVVNGSVGIAFSGGGSRIATRNGTAVEIRDSRLTAMFDSVSAEGVAPGVLNDGIVIDKLNAGKLTIGGGAIRNARAYGIRITQSSNIHLEKMTIADSGAATALCPEDVGKNTTVRCAAALYLRHVASSKFNGIVISGGGGAGVNANNVHDVTFEDVRISGVGTDATDPAVLLQETLGTIAFNRCNFADAAGGSVVVEQRFNSGRLSFDHCDMTSANRQSAYLVRAGTTGGGKLRLDFNALQLHDTAGSGVFAEASEASELALTFAQPFVERTGGAFADVVAHQSSRVAFSLHDARIVAPALTGRPLIAIDAGSAPADGVETCVDINENTLFFGGGAPAVRLHASSQYAKIRIVANGSASDAAALLGSMNRGAVVAIEVARQVALVAGCR